MIVIDPGHGGYDPGAVAGRVKESEINLAIATMLASQLESNGQRVVMTRQDDVYVSLKRRCDIANGLKNTDVILSVHCNAYADPRVRGFEFYTTPGWTYADLVLESVVESFRANFDRVEYAGYVAHGDPEKERMYYILRNTRAPAVLAEYGFLTNDGDRNLLSSVPFRRDVAAATCVGIMNYLERT